MTETERSETNEEEEEEEEEKRREREFLASKYRNTIYLKLVSIR